MKISSHRKKLGFEDVDEEVADPILANLYKKEAEYQKEIDESKERKSVHLVTPINAYSKKEIETQMLHDEEKFKPL